MRPSPAEIRSAIEAVKARPDHDTIQPGRAWQRLANELGGWEPGTIRLWCTDLRIVVNWGPAVANNGRVAQRTGGAKRGW